MLDYRKGYGKGGKEESWQDYEKSLFIASDIANSCLLKEIVDLQPSCYSIVVRQTVPQWTTTIRRHEAIPRKSRKFGQMNLC